VSPERRFERPPLPPDFDDSRARERRDDPAGWRFAEHERAGVWRAIAERRDIRRFRTDPLPEPLLQRLLEAAHQAPSVGLMQPWRFILIRSEHTKAAMQALAARERLVQADHFDGRARQYLDLKIEGIREAPLSICVCCDRDSRGREVLGRHTIPDTDLYSTCLAIENLWLAARAEGVGVGWVSFYQPADLSSLLGLPEHVVPVAWLCIGYPDERPSRPGLEAAGWDRRRRLDEFVFSERWGNLEAEQHTQTAAVPTNSGSPVDQPDWWQRLAAEVSPGDASAAVRVRDASDELVKPIGSLGGLETVIERWAMATGAPPPSEPRAGILVFAADHGVSRRRVSLYPARVGAQVAAAAARGETAIGVLADALGAELVVADVGLAGAPVPALTDRRVAAGTADITIGPALSAEQLRGAIEAGHALADDLAKRCDLIVLGEIGIGNTTVAAALLAALTGLSAEAVCGRGTGLDAQGLEHKQDTVKAALDANTPNSADPLECLRRLGGFELAALVGALLAAAAARRPVLLDGFATGVAALAACRLQPALRDYLIAGHRSAEPAHHHVLTELGLEPLLDLRLRLGEASGAALALPLIGLAARLHTEMRRFDEAGVERAPQGTAADRASQHPARD
jgi:nicotinate-nucleotide--dimethylbenzimidazole phosphoribosyltransferase